MPKLSPERRRRGNLRRRTRRKVGKAGIFKCAICKRYRYRQDMEAHHLNYDGWTGTYALTCKECHPKKGKTRRK
jgi:hypothetical protein